MTFSHCERLEDFLLKDLRPVDEIAFRDHLADCAACRWAVDQEIRWEDRIKTATETIACPIGLAPRVRRERDRQTHRQRAALGSLVAAGLVIGLWVWSIVSRNSPPQTLPPAPLAEESLPIPDRLSPPDPDSVGQEISEAKPSSPVQVEFPEDVLSLPIDSGEPDITLIQLFPVRSVAGSLP